MRNSGWIFIVLGGILLVILFALFKPPASTDSPPLPAVPAPAAQIAPAAAPVPVPAAGLKVFELVVKNGKLETGPAVVKVTEGDEVVLRISVDKADDLHLHGYDLHAHLKPGTMAELKFVANRTGRFEYELHKAHVDLGALEVHPK